MPMAEQRLEVLPLLRRSHQGQGMSIPTDLKWTCEHIMRSGTTRVFHGSAVIRCASLVEPGQRYCQVHRPQWDDKQKPRVKHDLDLDLDVLPWSEKTFGGK